MAASYCNNKPAIGLYCNEDPNTITYWTQPAAKKLKSRSKLSSTMTADTSTPSKKPLQPNNKRRGEIVYSNNKRLVLSSDTQHNASDLCSSPDSLGSRLCQYRDGTVLQDERQDAPSYLQSSYRDGQLF